MKLILTVIVLGLISCSISNAQDDFSQIINQFDKELLNIPTDDLDKATSLAKKIAEEYQAQYNSFFSDCEFKIQFYTKLTKFHNRNAKDVEVIILQKDSILKFQKECLPADHLDFARTYSNLGYANYWLGNIKQSQFYHNKAIQHHNDVGKYNQHSTGIYYFVGDFYEATKDYEKAILFLDLAEEIYKKHGSAKKETYAFMCLANSRINRSNNKLNEAERLILIALEVSKNDTSQRGYGLKSTAYEELAAIHYARKEYDKALVANENAIQELKRSGYNDIKRLNIIKTSQSYNLKEKEISKAHSTS